LGNFYLLISKGFMKGLLQGFSAIVVAGLLFYFLLGLI
jgi:hypothetical protein